MTTIDEIKIDGYGDGVDGWHNGDNRGDGEGYILASNGDGCGHPYHDDAYWKHALDGGGYDKEYGYQGAASNLHFNTNPSER